LIFILTGCGGNELLNTSVTGNVELTKGNYTKALNNVVVKINDKKVETNSEGKFKIEDLNAGEGTVEVFYNTDDEIISSLNQNQIESNKNILVHSEKISLDKVENIVNLEINPKVTVLKYYSDFYDKSKFQLAFYATPPANKKISSGYILDPNEENHKMEPHFRPQWHVWWNEENILTGNYEYDITFDDGSNEKFKVYIAETDFDIQLPKLNYPIENKKINTTTPTFEYDIPKSAKKIYLRIEEKNKNGEWESKKWIPVDSDTNYTIDEGILKAGEEYRWAIQTIHKAQIFAYTEAKSKYGEFKVEDF